MILIPSATSNPFTYRLTVRHLGAKLSFGWMSIAVVWASLGSYCFAQEELQAEFDRAVVDLRTALKETRRTGALFYHRGLDESDQWKAEWEAAGEKGLEAERRVRETAAKILFELADPPDDIVAVSAFHFQKLFENAKFDEAYKVISRLVELDPDDSDFAMMKARVAAKTNRFEEALQLKEQLVDSLTDLPEEELSIFSKLEALAKDFQRELEFRDAEQAADDLPRVELNTNKGKIIIELFENQAPDTVGNFISLVESGFYDGILFHRVIRGFMAQTGGYSMRGPQSVNYRIYDEWNREDFRQHFRGTVSMAIRSNDENSGNTQFFILASPRPYLDGLHTAFGRVISGMDVLESLTITYAKNKEGKEEPIETVIPDRIVNARVLRKRDHEYKPNRVKD